MGLFNWLPSRRRHHREEVNAAYEAAITEQREHAADAEIQAAYDVAHKLAAHRRKNHFAERMRAAYGRREGRA